GFVRSPPVAGGAAPDRVGGRAPLLHRCLFRSEHVDRSHRRAAASAAAHGARRGSAPAAGRRPSRAAPAVPRSGPRASQPGGGERRRPSPVRAGEGGRGQPGAHLLRARRGGADGAPRAPQARTHRRPGDGARRGRLGHGSPRARVQAGDRGAGARADRGVMLRRWRSFARTDTVDPMEHPSAADALALWFLGTSWVLTGLWLAHRGEDVLVMPMLAGGLLAVLAWHRDEWLRAVPWALVVAALADAACARWAPRLRVLGFL